MFTKLMAVLIAAVLVFGGAAATASAAQASLPVDAVYPIKTLGESVALGLSIGSAVKLEKALEHAQRRVDEMTALAEMSVDVPERVSADFVERVEYALRLAAKMPDDQMTQTLDKIRQSLQEQLAAVEQLRAARPDDAQLAGVEWQLRQRIGLVELGLSNPQMFREQLAAVLQGSEVPSSTQDPSVTEAPSVTETPAPGDDNSNNANSNDDDSNTNSDDSNTNSDDSNTNSDDSNTNSDDSNTNSDDSNTNSDDSNTNDDDDSNTNSDDDANSNDDDSNTNDDDDDSNTNDDDDDSNSNDDDSNGNGDDDDSNSNDDDSNSNGSDDDSNGNGDDDDSNSNDDEGNSNGSGGGSGGVILNTFFAFIARIGGLSF